MKKIIIAADSFKGSLSSDEVARCVKKGILDVFSSCDVRAVKIADGGEGTVDALVSSLKGELVEKTVNGPLMRPVKAGYGIIDSGKTAVIEMASASGLPLLAPHERNPLKTATYGTGELIQDALERGCRHFLIGIGGSASNDAGVGMLHALGFRFYNNKNEALWQGGEILSEIERIDFSNTLKGLKNAVFTVACDVNNPFSGPDGAACVFAPQKGADGKMVEQLDKGLHHFSKIIEKTLGVDVRNIPGSGAAGGLGGAFKAFLNAGLVSGIDMVLDAVKFDELIKDADLIITGEGKVDKQTMMGKAAQGVLSRAKKSGIPVIAIGGAVEDAGILNEQGFAAVFPILPMPVTLDKAMEPAFASSNITSAIAQIMKTIKTFDK
jgi:glycerate kinase